MPTFIMSGNPTCQRLSCLGSQHATCPTGTGARQGGEEAATEEGSSQEGHSSSRQDRPRQGPPQEGGQATTQAAAITEEVTEEAAITEAITEETAITKEVVGWDLVEISIALYIGYNLWTRAR